MRAEVIDPDIDPENVATHLLGRLMQANFDFHTVTRPEWRASCTGSQRAEMQAFLLNLAEAARVGIKADRRALCKAAYAVLPLENELLMDLCKQLLNEHPVSLEWCDVLVDVLAEPTSIGTSVVAEILDALKETMQNLDPTSVINVRNMRMICRQVKAAGYQPDWLAPYLELEIAAKVDSKTSSTNPI